LASKVATALRRRRPGAPGTGPDPAARFVRATVRVEYRPDDDGSPDPGEVVWAWIPFEEDPTQGKDRPVVVVGTAAAQLVAVTLTSKPHPERRDQVAVGSGAWDRDGRPSYARLDRILGLTEQQVRREGARLDRPRFDHLVDALHGRPGWPEVRLERITTASGGDPGMRRRFRS